MRSEIRRSCPSDLNSTDVDVVDVVVVVDVVSGDFWDILGPYWCLYFGKNVVKLLDWDTPHG